MRVLIAEHLSKVRFALRVTLERQPGLSMVSEVANSDELLAQAENLHPDLVLLDWELTDLDAENTLRCLRERCPHVFVIALSAKDKAREAAVTAGADAFVSKADPPERLLSAIGDYWNSKTTR